MGGKGHRTAQISLTSLGGRAGRAVGGGGYTAEIGRRAAREAEVADEFSGGGGGGCRRSCFHPPEGQCSTPPLKNCKTPQKKKPFNV